MGSSHFLRQVNIIIFVFRELILSPLFLHHLFILFIDFWVRSWITARSSPVRITRSSANACRYPGISLACLLSRLLNTKFQRTGLSTPPCGQPFVILNRLVEYFSETVNLLDIMLYIQLQVTLSILEFCKVVLMALKEMLSKARSMSRYVPSTYPFFNTSFYGVNYFM